ncbi:anthocyanidin 3-O-glucosyltransferase 5-like [Gastrolobium bilobum]|uniref:anthocyanidin 3-O-glucosyltransferase 5-like n=1 Tax=Gastrolobium bilobum TaxID=150636 RepID=UPI002AB101A0|nr:anthocyanidin 3-O-glucosyltransferase 5-like [Gastrolobium bilobum]
MELQKPTHVVLLSSPGLGHLFPVIELGNRFVLHHNFKVTIITVTSNAQTHILTPELCEIIEIPSPNICGLVENDAAVCTRLCVMMREAKPAIKSALSNMTLRPSALIVDIFCTEALSIAEEFSIRKYVYIASHAWFVSLLIYSPVLDKELKGQYVDQSEPLKIPGCKPVRPEDVIDPMLDRNDLQYEELLRIANEVPKSDGVLVNTWEEFQRKELEALRDGDLLGGILKVPVYSIGPIVRQHVSETDSLVVQWLDEQPSESVVYVSFGSGGTMSYEQMTELAWGLELSGQRFIWVVRTPIEGAADAAFFTAGNNVENENNQLAKYLPEGFISRTHKLGLLVPQWAPQVTILRHSSIGGFFSHCGWGSTLESITNGVPMIAWPLYAEQRLNATLLAEEVGVAVRSKLLTTTTKVVGREEIARMVRQIIQVDENVKSNPIREKAKEIKRSAMIALSKGGSSYTAFSQVAKIIEG